ncbi:hypothetical protein HYH03_014886 [Edaphochlamys debaryana]|uniref:MYND-type domain-containing protein n=1 Tax=Edaphochlamys debaryana TaxID=47281 RepID=A0A835XV70_9CHLO|nr:hypothetical protein HYH03_014886 [Edaphochlamys debaryana]|eukprot:KAG2486439.1 hypothetical protein HYH03_014886 [Edaphochlamys debaryana]
MATRQALEDAWRAYMRAADRLSNVYVERALWQPPQGEVRLRTKAFEDAKRALRGLAKPLGYKDAWLDPPTVVGDEAAAARLLWLAAAQEAGVAAWLLRTLGAIHTRVATATNPATIAWAVCNTADAACAASEAAGTALSLCLAALCTWNSAQGWGGTGPHAAALLGPALLTALAQAAWGMAALARHTALPSTQTLVGAAGSPRPPGPSCARACAALALTASQCFRTVIDLLAKHVGGVEEMEGSFTNPLLELVPQLAGALRESGLAAAAASTTMTCPGSPFHTVRGQAHRSAVPLPEGLESSHHLGPGWSFLVGLAGFIHLGLVLQHDTRPGAAQASAALGEALGHPEVAALRLAALEGLWELAGMGPGSDAGYEAEREVLYRVYDGSSQGQAVAHFRILSVTLGLWNYATAGQLFLAGGGCLPPEPGVPPEVQLARQTARSEEAVCRLIRGQGMWGLYGKVDLRVLATKLRSQGDVILGALDWGLPPAAWASAAAPPWAETTAWALAAAVEVLARSLSLNDDAAKMHAAMEAADAVGEALERVERVAGDLQAAWRREGSASSGRNSVLPRLRRAGLGASLDHALRLAYAAADRAAAPGAAAWDVELARLLEPVPARALGVVELLGLELLGPVEEGGGASLGPGLGLGEAGGLAVTVAKRAMALAGQLEERAEAAPAEAEAAAVLSQEGDAEAQEAAPGTIAAEGAEAATGTLAEAASPGVQGPGAQEAGPAAVGLPGSASAGAQLPSQAEALRQCMTALSVCLRLLRLQRGDLMLPGQSQRAQAAAASAPRPDGGAILTSPAVSAGPGDSAGAAAASPDAPPLETGADSAPPSGSGGGSSLAATQSAAACHPAGATNVAEATSPAAGARTPSPAPAAWGALASELEAYVMQAGSRLAACAAAEAAAGTGGPGPEVTRLVGNCLASIALLCRTSEPGSPPVEARLLALQPHRLAAAACKLLCAWRELPASPAADSSAGAAGGSGGGEAPGRAAPKTEGLQTWVTRLLPLAVARMAAHSPHLALHVQSWLLPPPADGCTEAEEAGSAAEAEERGCLLQAWPAALRSQAAAGAKDASALGLTLLRAAQGGGGVDGGESGPGCSGGSDECPMPHDCFRQAAACLLEWCYAKGRGEHGPPTAMVAELSTPRPGEDSGALSAEAEAAVVAAPLPPLLAPPPAVRVLTQLLACGGPGCDSFGGRSEAELPLKRCGGCKAVRYCGSACQRAHWRLGHRAECGAMAAAAARMRAEGDSRLCDVPHVLCGTTTSVTSAGVGRAGEVEAGVAAWLLRTLGAIHTRVATATNPATTALAVCNTADAACAASEAAGTALSLCLAALCTWNSAQGWGGTGPHAAALLDPALLTALAQAAWGMAALARHTALRSTQALVGAAGSPCPAGPSCARACAALALAASQYLQTAMLVLADHLGGVEEMEGGFTKPLPGLVPQLAGALRESGLAAAAARAIMTCPGPSIFRLTGQTMRSAVAVPKGLEPSRLTGPCGNFAAALSRFIALGVPLRYDPRPGAAQASAALGEALGQPEVAELRLAMLEGLWEQAGMGPGSDAGYEAEREVLCRVYNISSWLVAGRHMRVLSVTLGLWSYAYTGQLVLAGGGCLPPEPSVPPEVQLARQTARSEEAVCRLIRGQGMWGLYSKVELKTLPDKAEFLYPVLQRGLPPATWASAAAPPWAEATAWALATAVEALAQNLPGRDGSEAPQTDVAMEAAEDVATALARVERVAGDLEAAWRRAASSGRDSVLPRLRRAGLGASLDHALRLAYAAADRAAAPGAAAWDEGGGASLGPREGLGLGDAGGLAVTVAKRALALAGQLEERAEAAPTEAGAAAQTEAEAAAVLSQERDAEAQEAAPGTIAAEGAEAATGTLAEAASPGAQGPGAEEAGPAAVGLPGSASAGAQLPSQAEALRQCMTALSVCLRQLRLQRGNLMLPGQSQRTPAAAASAPRPDGGATLTSPAVCAGPGDSAGAAAASPDAPPLETGADSGPPSGSGGGSSLAATQSAAACHPAGATNVAEATSPAAGARTPSPAPAAWGALASELEAYVMQAGSRLAACAAAEAAAGTGGPGPEVTRLVGNCLASIALLCRTSEPGSPPVEARLLALQPHRLAAAACKLLCAWRELPASPAADSSAGAAGGSGGGEAPGRAAPKTEGLQTWVTRLLPLAVARMAAHSPHLALHVQSWLLPPPADGCTEAEEAGSAAEAEERGCLLQAWPAALRSQAAAGAKDASALGLTLLRAAQGGGGVGGGENGPGCSGGSDGCPMPHDCFRQAAACLLEWCYAKGRGEHGPPTAMVAELVTPRPGEDSGALSAEAEAAVVAAPLPPLLAPPPAVRVLTQLLACGGPGCDSFGGRSEAELPLKRCGGCKAVRYCGPACQRSHWRLGHRAECGAMGPTALMRAGGVE